MSILSHHPSFEHWLFMNHIQLHVECSGAVIYIGFYEPIARKHYPLIDLQKIRKDVIEKNGLDVIQFLKNAIDENYYAYMCVDTYYIAQYPLYQRSHFPHDMFVFGYDDASSTLHIADFLMENRYYATQSSYEQIRQAFHSEYDVTYGFDGIQLLKVKDDASFPLDIDWIITMLEDYVTGFDTSKRYLYFGDPHVPGSKYGIDIYPELMDYIRNTRNYFWTARALHVLSDHKKLMRMRAEYLAANGYMADEQLVKSFTEIENLSMIIRNSFLKYAIHPVEEKLAQIINWIRQMYEQEPDLYRRLISKLKQG
jgi:hypothetical protein